MLVIRGHVYKLIPLLTDPVAHGGDAADAFDVVVPSLPGSPGSPASRRAPIRGLPACTLAAAPSQVFPIAPLEPSDFRVIRA